MAIPWGTRRKMLYIGVFSIIAVAGLLALLLTFFNKPPICSDGIRNGAETGVDCGGTCALICMNVSHQPIVVWARSFAVSQSNYTAAAYVQNTNPGAGSHNVQYTFKLYDKDNGLILEKDGSIDMPPVQTVPIVEPNISVGTRIVARTLFTFTSTPVWYKVAAGSLPAVSISQESLANNGTSLSALITNNGLEPVKKISIAAVLFDSNGTALAASKTVIPNLPAKSQQPITFTWPLPVAGVAHAEITVLPSF